MEKNNLLIEIGTEEIPARFINELLSTLRVDTAAMLNNNEISFEGAVKTTGTMRRLCIFVQDVAEKQRDRDVEVKGPSKIAAFDKEGNPTKAALGFASSQGVEVKDLVIKNAGGGDYVFACKHIKGKPSSKVLTELVPKVLSSLFLPVSMKWGEGDYTFIRPVHYILALLGTDVLKFEFAGVKSSNKVKGHRFLFNNKYYTYNKSADYKGYLSFLHNIGVVLEPEERLKKVVQELSRFEGSKGAQVIKDDDLKDETSCLVENPIVLEGRFDNKFITVLPQDVISTVVKKQQKCFPVKGSSSFLIVADGRSSKETVAGYEKVINARLSDAKFFYDEDIKIPLESNLEKLKKIVYHQKVGSMWDKTQRVISLSAFIASDLLDQKSIVPLVQRIAELSKADLPTHMVGEFSGLAGIMGREYSLVEGEDARVSRGIYEHYLPRFSQDTLPEDIAGAVVGIADRIDSIASCFAAGIIPTGSEDPYGLRRAAQGIVSVIVGKNLDLPVITLIKKGLEMRGAQGEDNEKKITDFIRQRLKVMLEAEGVRYDVADAALRGSDRFIKTYCKAFEMMKSLNEPWFKGIVMASDRVERILSGTAAGKVRPEDFIEEGETSLYKAAVQVKDIVGDELSGGNYSPALRALSGLTSPLETFFDKILVMHKEEKVKENRLALLSMISNLYLEFADFPRIVM